MAEEDKRTEEEKLIADVAAGAADSAADDAGEDQEISPEKKLIAELHEKAKTAEERALVAERERDTERTQKDTAKKEAANANNDKIKAYENTVNSNLLVAKTGLESARKEYLEAYNAGDPDAVVTAQMKLNDAQNALRTAEYNDSQMKTWKEAQKNQVAVERFIPEEKEWIKNNPWFERGASKEDRKKTAAVYAAVEEANQKGIKRGSQEYFNLVDEYLGEEISEPAKTEKKPAEESKVVKKKEASSSTAAPSNGSTGASTKTANSKVFHMTAEHRSMVPTVYPELYKKDPKAAEERYAAKQLEIQERRKRGERI